MAVAKVEFRRARAHTQENATILIPLTRGQCAIIDAQDAPAVAGIKWSALKGRYTWYAVSGTRTVYMHRLLTGAGKGSIVDHINGNGLDNRRCNLRIVSQSLNVNNSLRTKGNAPYRGVSWDKQKQLWRACLNYDGHQHFLGYFRKPEDAALAYDLARRERFGNTVPFHMLPVEGVQ